MRILILCTGNSCRSQMAEGFLKAFDDSLEEAFDYVITVCGHAKENCPVFLGEVKHQLHIGFDDPAEATGTEEEVMGEFRRIRDEIRERMLAFLESL